MPITPPNSNTPRPAPLKRQNAETFDGIYTDLPEIPKTKYMKVFRKVSSNESQNDCKLNEEDQTLETPEKMTFTCSEKGFLECTFPPGSSLTLEDLANGRKILDNCFQKDPNGQYLAGDESQRFESLQRFEHLVLGYLTNNPDVGTYLDYCKQVGTPDSIIEIEPQQATFRQGYSYEITKGHQPTVFDFIKMRARLHEEIFSEEAQKNCNVSEDDWDVGKATSLVHLDNLALTTLKNDAHFYAITIPTAFPGEASFESGTIDDAIRNTMQQLSPEEKAVATRSLVQYEFHTAAKKVAKELEKLTQDIKLPNASIEELNKRIPGIFLKFFREDSCSNVLLAIVGQTMCWPAFDEFIIIASPQLAGMYKKKNQEPLATSKGTTEFNPGGAKRASKVLDSLMNVLQYYTSDQENNEFQIFVKTFVSSLNTCCSNNEFPELLQHIAPSCFLSFLTLKIYQPMNVSFLQLANNKDLLSAFQNDRKKELNVMEAILTKSKKKLSSERIKAKKAGIKSERDLLKDSKKDASILKQRSQDLHSIYQLLNHISLPGNLDYNADSNIVSFTCPEAIEGVSDEVSNVVKAFYPQFRQLYKIYSHKLT